MAVSARGGGNELPSIHSPSFRGDAKHRTRASRLHDRRVAQRHRFIEAKLDVEIAVANRLEIVNAADPHSALIVVCYCGRTDIAQRAIHFGFWPKSDIKRRRDAVKAPR